MLMVNLLLISNPGKIKIGPLNYLRIYRKIGGGSSCADGKFDKIIADDEREHYEMTRVK